MASIDKDLRRRLENGARITAQAARELSAKFSTRIPFAISVLSDSKGVAVSVDSTKAPSARPNEFGLRHPVFGNRDVWRSDPLRPFLETAADRTADAVANEVINYADDLWGAK